VRRGDEGRGRGKDEAIEGRWDSSMSARESE
jgi:hypothetical protein